MYFFFAIVKDIVQSTKLKNWLPNIPTMNTNALIKSLRSENDLQVIARITNVDIDQLKSFIIDSIQQRKETHQEHHASNVTTDTEDHVSSSGYDTDDDDEEDMYDQIIRQSHIQFSDEQLEFMRLAVKERLTLALLAPAGYGKSAIINTTVKLFCEMLQPYSDAELKKKYGRFADVDALMRAPKIGLCASTGKAASLIKGRTIHSYLGIGIGKGSVDDWIKRVSTARYLRETFNNLRAVQVVIIDEISMISAELLDKISEYLQRIRKCDEIFGGIQMIFVGDICQLAPVIGRFMFKSKEYQAANVTTFRLTKCFRQSDPTLLKILNEIRYGECSDESFAILKAQTSIDEEYSTLKPMRILATNNEVDRINEQELASICKASGLTPTTFPIKMLTGDTKKAEAYRKAEMIPELVKLVVGAQIVITHNINRTVVNGSQGVVKSIKANEITVSLLDIGDIVISYIGFKDPECPDIYMAKPIFDYLPVRLAWASTVHKIQGCSLKLLEVDLKNIFCHGQTYVALSRVQTLSGLLIKNLSRKAFICDREVKVFYGVS